LATGCVTTPGGGFGGFFGGGGGAAGLPISHEAALNTAVANSTALILQANQALGYLNGMNLANDVLGRPALTEPQCDEFGSCWTDGSDIKVELADAVDDVQKFLAEQAMVASTLVTGSETEVRYAVDPKILCKSSSSQNTCVKLLKNVPAVLRVTSSAPGSLTVHLLVTDIEVEIATFELTPELARLTLSLDLDKASSAACKASPLSCLGKAISQTVSTLWNGDPDLQIDTKDFGGTIVAEWRKIGPDAVQASVLTLGTVRYAFQYKGQAYAVSLAPSSIVAASTAVNQSIKAQVKIGQADVTLPYDVALEPFAKCEVFTEWGSCELAAKIQPKGSLKATLAGLSMSSTMTRGEQAWSISDVALGAGATTLTHGAKTLASLTMSPTTGISAAISMPTREAVAVQVNSGFTADGTLALSHLAADADLAEVLRDETLRAVLGGAPVKVEVAKGQVALKAGSASITANPLKGGATTERSFQPGACIDDHSGTNQGGLLSLLQQVPCKP
jgi:hypothetical protein